MIPYLLLGILTAGTAAGAGVSLSAAPITRSASAVLRPVDREPTKPGTFSHFFENGATTSPALRACFNRLMKMIPTGSAAYGLATRPGSGAGLNREFQRCVALAARK
jgi:hypothetical protein